MGAMLDCANVLALACRPDMELQSKGIFMGGGVWESVFLF